MSEIDEVTEQPDVFPWPPAEDGSAIDALGQTWKEAMFSPAQFFAKMPKEESAKPALLYAFLICLGGIAVTFFWSFVLPRHDADMTPQELMQHPLQLLLHPARPSLMDILLYPLYIMVALFVGAGLLQLMLMMFVKERGSYWRTLRVVCYTRSPAILVVVPLLGSFVGGIWTIVITIIGVREAHNTSTGRATTAVLLPGCGLLVLVGILGAIIAIAMAGSGVLGN